MNSRVINIALILQVTFLLLFIQISVIRYIYFFGIGMSACKESAQTKTTWTESARALKDAVNTLRDASE